MDRAEAIKRLEDLTTTWDGDPFVQKSVDAFKMAIAALREQAVQPSKEVDSERDQSKWISVKERLPEEEIDVLARCYYNANWCLQVCHISGWMKGRWYTSVAGQYVEVSHWMPLPEPPEEGAER